MMKKPVYTAAIVGLGNVAWKYRCSVKGLDVALTHADAYQRHSTVELIAGCSPLKQDREDFSERYNVAVFDSIDTLFDKMTPDIVSICSPSELHFEHTLKCFNHDVPMIWLEKPPTIQLSEISRLVEEQKKHRSVVLVNYQRRYCQCYRQLKDLYVNNILGEVKFINLAYSRGLVTNGSHMIDILSYILGDDAGLSVEHVLSSENDGSPSFVLSSSSGLQIFVTGLSLPYHCADVVLTCENGRASILYGGMETKVEIKSEHELFKGFYRLKEHDSSILGHGDVTQAMPNAIDDIILSHEQEMMPQSNLITSSKTIEVISKVA